MDNETIVNALLECMDVLNNAYDDPKSCTDAYASAKAALLTFGEPDYELRVRILETEGMCTSDAQGVADAEDAKAGRARA